MLEVGAHDSWCTLRLHDHLTSSLVHEVEHLLRHDITRLTRRVDDKALEFEDGSGDTSESIGTKFMTRDLLQEGEVALVFTEYILHAADSWRELHKNSWLECWIVQILVFSYLKILPEYIQKAENHKDILVILDFGSRFIVERL